MNKICTTIEQSQKLIELGVDVNTADMFYADLLVDGNHKYNLHPLESYGFKTFDETKLKTSDHLGFIPAWSLTVLLESMPLINEYNIEYRPIIEHYEDGGWACKYYNEETRNTNDIYIRRYGKTPLDAAFEMVVWLKENNKL